MAVQLLGDEAKPMSVVESPAQTSQSRGCGQDVAEHLAQQIAECTSRRGRWREVRELLGELGFERLSPQAREQMSGLLAAAGVQVSPPLAEVHRRDTVVLSVNRHGQP